MANTTNLNLEKPLGTDKALVARINSNSDKIDTWAGTTNQAIATLNSNIAKSETANVDTATGVTKVGFNAKKQLNIVYVKGIFAKKLRLNSWNELCTLPSGYRPSEVINTAFINTSNDIAIDGKIESDGKVLVYPVSATASENSINVGFCVTFIQ